MTTRRELLGLLAAVPMAKTFKFADGGALTHGVDARALKASLGDIEVRVKDAVDAAVKEQARRMMRESFPPILDVHVWGVPNRLAGVQINSEGEAI